MADSVFLPRSGTVKSVTVPITQTVLENLGSAPLVLAAAVPGMILNPLIAIAQVDISDAFDGSPNIALRWAAGTTQLSTNAPLDCETLGVNSVQLAPAGVAFVESGLNPTNKPIIMTGASISAGVVDAGQITLYYTESPGLS